MSVIESYAVRESARARHIRLKFSARNGLIVIVPRGFDRDRLPALLESKRPWLEAAQARHHEQRKFLVPDPPGQLPERITLRVIGQDWAVNYRATQSTLVTAVERGQGRLLVFGNVEDENAAKEALRRWLSRQTHTHLVPWLSRLAQENDLEFSRVLVKAQRTRWASCSARRIISLNIGLLFLPEPLVRYVLVHELAHTREMNHSPRFWATVRAMELRYDDLDTQLRAAWRLVPAWLQLSGP